ncbi:MAG: protein kinase [Phycisphaerales bacterium]
MAKRASSPANEEITSFNFHAGRILARKYEVVDRLGAGYEGEVYLLRELGADIERAAKFFFPHRNRRDAALNRYAKKLHKLRDCPILVQYRTREQIQYRRQPISFLVSDFVEGEPLSDFLRRQPGKRLGAFEALHLIYAIAKGIEPIHDRREYHGDLHSENVIVRRQGISFRVKLVDLFHWGPPSMANVRNDVFYITRMLYEAIGGRTHYSKQPQAVKNVVCGLKDSLIAKKFRTAGDIRRFLETVPWDRR